MRFRAKITLTFLAIGIFSIGLLVAVSLFFNARQLESSTIALGDELAVSSAEVLSGYFQTRKAEMAAYAHMPLFRSMDWERIGPFLRAEQARHEGVYEKMLLGLPDYPGHYYITTEGNPYFGGLLSFDNASPEAKLKSIATRDYWLTTAGDNPDAEARVYVSNPMVSYFTGVRQIMVAASIVSEDGSKLLGMVSGSVAWAEIDRVLGGIQSTILQSFGKEARMVLISHDGTYIYHYDENKAIHLLVDAAGQPIANDIGENTTVAERITEEAVPEVAAAGRALLAKEAGNVSFYDETKRETMHLFYAPVNSAGYGLGIVVPDRVLMQPLRRFQHLVGLLAAVALGLIVFFSYLSGREATRPLDIIREKAVELSGGNWNAQIDYQGKDEFGILAASFNRMVDELQARDRTVTEAHERLLTILDGLDAGVYVADMQTYEIIFINRPIRDDFGDITGRLCWKHLHAGNDRPCPFCNNKYLVDENGRPTEVYTKEELNSVTGCWYYVQDRAIEWVDGRIVRLHIATDITEKKEAEEALRQSEERLKLAMSGANDGVWDWDLRTDKVLFDSRYYTMAGYEPGEFPGAFDEWKKRLHPDDKRQTLAAVEEYLEGKRDIYDVEFRLRRKDGEYMWIRGRGKAVEHDAEGKPSRFVGTHSDISELKQVEEALRQSQTHLRTVFETIPDLMWLKDPDGVYISCNARFERFFGAPEAEIVGKTDYDFVARDLADLFRENDRAAIATGGPRRNEEEVTFADDGHRELLETVKTPVYDPDGHLIGVLGVGRDITERKLAEEALRESEDKYRMLFEMADDAIHILDGLVMVECNPRALAMFGCEAREEMVGRSVLEFFPRSQPDGRDSEEKVRGYLEAAQEGRPQNFYLRTVRKDGTFVELDVHMDRIILGGKTYVQSVSRDITEQRKHEEERGRLISIFEATSDLVSIAMPGDGLVYLNSAGRRMLGLGDDEDTSKMTPQSAHPPWAAKILLEEAFPYAIAHGMWKGETALLGPDGSEIPVSQVITAHKDVDGNVDYFSTIIRDISEQKRAQEALRNSERSYRELFHNSKDAIFVHDPETGQILDVNKTTCEMFGYPLEEVKKLSIADLSLGKPPYSQAEALERVRGAGTEGPQEFEWLAKHRNGRLIWVDIVLVRAVVTGAERVLVFAHDITDRKRAQEELVHLRNYLSNIIDSMPSILVGVDTEGRVTQWNKTAQQTTGIPAGSALGRSLLDVFPQMTSEIEIIAESIRTRQARHLQKRPRPSMEGTSFEDITVYPLVSNGVEGAVVRIDDVTDKVRMEEMMIQSEKMLSVGGLAAGMAHEINNPLAGMIQTASVLAQRLSVDLPANVQAAGEAGTSIDAVRAFMEARQVPEMLAHIRESGNRAAKIVANMLSFARKGDSTFLDHNLAELLDQSLELAGSDYDLKKQFDFRQIEIIREYEEDLPAVPCESGKIQQVLLNILRNGAEAMQEGSRHEAEQGTRSGPRFVLRLAHEREAGMVRLEIEDNGPGMDEATRRRIFEPFFTTKPTDQGTGLGLSVSYFIITENHGGRMSVESTPGRGTRFIIRLPVQRRQT